MAAYIRRGEKFHLANDASVWPSCRGAIPRYAGRVHQTFRGAAAVAGRAFLVPVGGRSTCERSFGPVRAVRALYFCLPLTSSPTRPSSVSQTQIYIQGSSTMETLRLGFTSKQWFRSDETQIGAFETFWWRASQFFCSRQHTLNFPRSQIWIAAGWHPLDGSATRQTWQLLEPALVLFTDPYPGSLQHLSLAVTY